MDTTGLCRREEGNNLRACNSVITTTEVDIKEDNFQTILSKFSYFSISITAQKAQFCQHTHCVPRLWGVYYDPISQLIAHH